MSKNLTRKGLAFGALVALGASVFAGAPAYAADSLVLAANYTADTTLATASTEAFTLNASLAPGSVAANISQLKYKVVNNGALTVTATPQTNAVDGTPATVTQAAGYGYATPTSPSTTQANTLKLATGGAYNSTTQTVTVTAFLDANGNNLLDSGETQATQTVSFIKYSEITTSTTITAPGEGDTSASAVVKYTNINAQALTSTNVGAYFTKGDGTAFTVPTLTATAASATVASNVATVTVASAHNLSVGDIVVVASSTGTLTNGTYVVTAVPSATTYSFAFTAADGALTLTGAAFTTFPTVLKTRVAYSSSLGGFKYTTGTIYSTGTTGLAKATAVKVQPLLKSAALVIGDGASATTVAAVAIGSAQTAQVTAHAVGSLNGNTVKSTTATAATSASGTTSQDVALNTEKQVYFITKDTASTPAALAGQTVNVTVTVTGAALSAVTPVTLTVNGTTYSSAATLPGAPGVAKLALVTGADGKAVITYKTSGFGTGHTVVFTATVENYTATVTGTERTRNFAGTGTPTVANSTYIANYEGDAAVTTDGKAVAVNVVVQDQFGGAPTNGTYQVTATWDATLGGYVAQATAASTVASGTFAAVVDGKATLNITDNGTGNGTNQYIIELRPVAANGVLGTAEKVIASIFTIKIASAADNAPGEVVLAGTGASLSASTGLYGIAAGNSGASDTPKALTYSAFANSDGRAINVAAPANTDVAGGAVTGLAFTGTVNSASTSTYGGVAVPGASVTVSGTGLQFSITQDGAAIYGDGSLTFVTNATGQFSLTAWSHVAGKNTITVTSGTGKATYVVYFAAASVGAASSVSVTVADGAAQFQAGRALDVTFKVTDKFGNPVQTAAVNSATSNDGQLTIGQTGSGYLAVSGAVRTNTAGTYTTKLITNAGDLGTSNITATLDMGTVDGLTYNATTNPYLADITKAISSEFGVTDADVTVGGRAVYASVEFAKGKTVTVSVDGKRLYSKLSSTDAYTELKFTQKTAGKHVVTVRISGGIVYSETVVTTK